MTGVLINGIFYECAGGQHFDTLARHLDEFYTGNNPDKFISNYVVFIYDSCAYAIDEDVDAIKTCTTNRQFMWDNDIVDTPS